MDSIKYGLLLITLYLGYYHFNIFIKITISLGIIFLIVTASIAAAIYYRLLRMSPDKRDHNFALMFGLVKKAAERRLYKEDFMEVYTSITS